MIAKAVIPAAGLGTRFLPATKVLPKELLPVVDRPVIEWAVDEARSAGVEEVVLITSPGKELLMRHFVLDEAGLWERPAEVAPSAVVRFGELVAAAARPIDDVRGTAAYRKHALEVLARRTFVWAWDEYRMTASA